MQTTEAPYRAIKAPSDEPPPTQAGFALGACIFLSALLLFEVQPMIGKFILPWFGGTPAVWTTCVLFFQALLVIGYAYAHVLTRWFSPRVQAIIHCLLLAAALLALPKLVPSEGWKPRPQDNPTAQILLLLSISVGLPYLVLSTTGPLLQGWFHRLNPRRSPYRLYALSNFGSLLALLGYPFIIEPLLSRHAQARAWSLGMCTFALICAYCAIRARRPEPLVAPSRDVKPPPALPSRKLNILHLEMWILLPACASALLLATTNKMCQDVAVVPFLWVLPLAIYLLTFIICFDQPRWYTRWAFMPLLIGAFVAAVWVLTHAVDPSIILQISIYAAILFICCMVCHGEVVRLKPDPQYLTAFYLCIALGGAIGGLLVAVVAPIRFNNFAEYPLGILACCALASAMVVFDRKSLIWRVGIVGGSIALAELWIIGIGGAAYFMADQSIDSDERVISRSRNFYGVLTVVEGTKSNYRALMHGAIRHGSQYTDEGETRKKTTYYGPDSGAGMTMRLLHPDQPRRFAVIGLGVGTMAAYPEKNDFIRFYEINPQVQRLAETYFTYLKECPGKVDVALGNARLTMDRETPQNYDVIVIDAFSGDAIPIHLLTAEAMKIYLKHLRPDGVIAVHVTNRHLDLRPVVIALAKMANLEYRVIWSDKDYYEFACTWILLSSSADFLNNPKVLDASIVKFNPPLKQVKPWTDDQANLLEILR